MTARHARRVGGLLAVAATIWVQSAAGAAAPLTHLEVQARLVDELAAQLLPPLARVPQGALLSMRDAGGDSLAQVIADTVAAHLTRRGVEVWIAPNDPGAVDSTMAAGWVLDLKVLNAGFVIDPPTKGFLVFHAGRSHRQASVRLSAVLRLTAQEPPVWSGFPSAAYVDDFAASRAAEVGGGTPAWMTEALGKAPKAAAPRPSWTERIAVMGLIGGVVLIYAAGAN